MLLTQVLVAGAIAALSVMTAGLVRLPAADPVLEPDPSAEPLTAVPREVQVVKQVRYVQLKRGETPPPELAAMRQQLTSTKQQLQQAQERQVLAETRASDVSERGASRADDKTSEAAMEDRKRGGYF